DRSARLPPFRRFHLPRVLFRRGQGKGCRRAKQPVGGLDTLRDLVTDRPFQSVYVDSLERLARIRADLARDMIEMREERGVEAAIEEVRRGEGKRVMDDVRELVETMLERENTVLRERTQAEDGNLRRNSWILYAVVALF